MLKRRSESSPPRRRRSRIPRGTTVRWTILTRSCWSWCGRTGRWTRPRPSTRRRSIVCSTPATWRSRRGGATCPTAPATSASTTRCPESPSTCSTGGSPGTPWPICTMASGIPGTLRDLHQREGPQQGARSERAHQGQDLRAHRPCGRGRRHRRRGYLHLLLPPLELGFDMDRFHPPHVAAMYGGYGLDAQVGAEPWAVRAPAIMCHFIREILEA